MPVDPDAIRGRTLIEESREIIVLLDERDCILSASRRARESIAGLELGRPLPESAVTGANEPFRVEVDIDGRRETLVYLNEPGGSAAYEELRAGFTAAVSHELRTPLARLLALLETAALPDEDVTGLIDRARLEVEQIRELIDDVLFLSELETGRQVVSLTSTHAAPVLEQVAETFAERAARAGVTISLESDPGTEIPLRPRMLRVVVENLTENAIRYAGPGTRFVLSVEHSRDEAVLRAVDDGAGVREDDLPRLFERFYRADRARASRGTGLGLAIVKHIVTSAGGSVQASGSRGHGLEVRCLFPVH